MKLAGSASQRAKSARQRCQPAKASGKQASDVSKLVSHCLWAGRLADALRSSLAVPGLWHSLDVAHRRSQLSGVGPGLVATAVPDLSP